MVDKYDETWNVLNMRARVGAASRYRREKAMFSTPMATWSFRSGGPGSVDRSQM
jgi:hypothetical protein